MLAVGLWFGTVVFFTFVVGLELFGKFQPLAENEDRPSWLPLAEPFRRDPQTWGPEGTALFKDAREVRREQGTRVAGTAVSPMFPWYFLIQGVCALVALATALRWSGHGISSRVHWTRVKILIAALLTVAVGWLLEMKVSNVRSERNDQVDHVLQATTPTPAQLQQAAELKNDFVRWHLYSLFLNLATVLLVTVAMILTANLPQPASLASSIKAEQRATVPG